MICSHPEQTIYRTYRKSILYQCLDCGLVFSQNRLTPCDPKELYANFYKNEAGGRFSFGLEVVIRLFRFFRAIKVFSIDPRAKSIFDIGSGRGFMLYYLKKYFGYRVAMGTQPSRPALEFSRKELGLEIFQEDFLELPLGNRTFDIITMWHVLEHVAEPERYVERIARCLKPGGTLVVEVPNLRSWTACFTGGYWLGLDLKHHLYFFTPRSLSRMLTKHGFEITHVHTFSLEYSIFISAQSIANFLTRSEDVVFNWLQRGGFKGIPVAHILLFMVLVPLCFIVNAALFFSRRGEILLIVSRKKD
jgi:2-polyprenyl-3-methyl-5-hydroxy-6-metoxy-1,4-benzoquinol methylase